MRWMSQTLDYLDSSTWRSRRRPQRPAQSVGEAPLLQNPAACPKDVSSPCASGKTCGKNTEEDGFINPKRKVNANQLIIRISHQMPTRRSSERLRSKRRKIIGDVWAFWQNRWQKRAASYAWFLPKLFIHRGLPADICAIIWSFIIGPRPKDGTSWGEALDEEALDEALALEL